MSDGETAGGSRRSQLLGIKLRALVAQHLGHAVEVTPTGLGDGAAVVVDGAAWVLVDGDAERSLGPALAWAVRQGADRLHVIAEHHTGHLARRAQQFRLPISVWYPVDRTLLAAPPEPLPPPRTPTPRHLAAASVIRDAGASILVEHGVVTGDVRGLEVCRIVDTPTTGYFDEPDGELPISALTIGDASIGGAARSDDVPDDVVVEVGVGAPDREAFRIIHGDLPTVDALAGVVSTVSEHRTLGAPPHPLNRLAQERFLRWRLQEDPGLVGLRDIRPIEPPTPRRGLKDTAPCVATGSDPSREQVAGEQVAGEQVAEEQVAVVCSVGVDIDLIPFVADVQLSTARPVLVVLPSRDLVPITRELGAQLVEPIGFRTVD